MAAAKNAVTRLTLALMYATDFSIRWSTGSCPRCVRGRWFLRTIYFHADRARCGARINRDYMGGLYAMALRPHLTFWLNVRRKRVWARVPQGATTVIGSGADMSAIARPLTGLSFATDDDQAQFEVMASGTDLSSLNGEASVSTVNKQLRQRIGEQLGIAARNTRLRALVIFGGRFRNA